MKDIKITVTKKVASVEGTPIIVCGNSDYTLSFTFDDEWSNEQNKVARFSFIKNGLKSFIDMPIHDNACQVPVLIGIGLVRVGAYAGDLKTTTGAKIKCHKSILCDDADTMAEPFENLYEELLKKINEIEVTGGGLSPDDVVQEIDPEKTYEDTQIFSANAIIKNLVQVLLSGEYAELVSNKVNEIDPERHSATNYPTEEAVIKFGELVIEVHRREVNEQIAEIEELIGGIENGSY